MTTPNPSEFRQAINRAHELMQHQSHQKALGALLDIKHTIPVDDPDERAELLQLMGVQYRSMGNLQTAVDCGQRSLASLAQSDNRRLKASIQRDLALSLQKYALWRLLMSSTDGAHASTSPEKELHDAMHHIQASAAAMFDLGMEAEAVVATGIEGAFFCDLAAYTPGTRRDTRRRLRQRGRLMLETADYRLQQLDHPVFELNNLLRRIRHAGLVRRLRLLPRALRLSSSHSVSPAARWKVWAAMTGNRIVTRQELKRAAPHMPR